jgi:hypothetical protein
MLCERFVRGCDFCLKAKRGLGDGVALGVLLHISICLSVVVEAIEISLPDSAGSNVLLKDLPRPF